MDYKKIRKNLEEYNFKDQLEEVEEDLFDE